MHKTLSFGSKHLPSSGEISGFKKQVIFFINVAFCYIFVTMEEVLINAAAISNARTLSKKSISE
jgi:hypothetical protein